MSDPKLGKYANLNLQKALRHPYTSDQASQIARALGVDPSDTTKMGEIFSNKDSSRFLSRNGVEMLAAKQEQWRAGKHYKGTVDAIWGVLSEAAAKKVGINPLGADPITPAILPAVNVLGAEPVVVNARNVLGAEPVVGERVVAQTKRDWTPV